MVFLLVKCYAFQQTPRTIENFRKEFADNHPKVAAVQISKGTNVITCTILSQSYFSLMVKFEFLKRLHKSQDYKLKQQTVLYH